MIAFDTNILFPAIEKSHVHNQKAKEFLQGLRGQKVVLSELNLLELYQLIRNPKVCAQPLNEKEAFHVIQSFRKHPDWELVDYPGKLMEDIWRGTLEEGFARRRVFDLRLSRTLIYFGVKDFATRNTKDFQGAAFRKVWDPFEE